MKVCLLGDTHFGVRNDAKHFHEYYEKFYTQQFFPYLEKHGVKTIIQLGDLFDRRKYINFMSLSESRRYFFDVLKEKDMHLHALIGNHDIFYRNTLEVNSPELVLKDYDNITLWSKPGTLDLDGFMIDMIPWICNDNEKEVYDFISKSLSPYCVGHFELLGYQMYPGMDSHDGYSADFLQNYDQVYSGHYHTRSKGKNVEYLGVPYELFWNDYKDPKGFFILDTETKELEFVQNPHRMFYKITYDDSKLDLMSIKKTTFEELTNTYIKIIVVYKSDPYIFDALLDQLYKANPIDINIVEDFNNNGIEDDEEINQAEDTLTILSNYIDTQTLQVEPEKLKKVMRELYLEALSSTENNE
jgi:hypothetical protein